MKCLSEERRFWDKVQKSDSCWIWTGYQNQQGYGRFRANGTKMLAHRFSYELHGGILLPGLVLDHLCRNPPCVNPDHLEQVTAEENLARGLINEQVQRTCCKHGHEYTSINTRLDARGHRVCRTCQCNYQADAYARRKAATGIGNPYRKRRA